MFKCSNHCTYNKHNEVNKKDYTKDYDEQIQEKKTGEQCVLGEVWVLGGQVTKGQN